ncbi:MAG: class I SAM-dependent methyltransferase [Bacteroidales bacterium]|jgi:2-polyprenyl-3-methyl-5-hydroxy-6-metoxy-1,4-benzoquinol methylase|nr:class I SAM-dependent methyltransferase [Bacteroidales bacterium]
MVHYSQCPLCNSGNIGKYLPVTDHFLSKEGFELLKCAICGFVFTQDHPDENNINRYYESDDYISHNDSVKGFSVGLYRLSRRIMLKKKREIVFKITGLNRGHLLDIGSGTGHFISVMKKRKWMVQGIEINDKAREYSVSQRGLDVISPTVISSLPSGSFDCITMWHVLEHFQDPFGYAAEIKRLLKPGGTCIAALPNCMSFDAMHYRDYWAAYDVPRHLWHFTPATFRIFSEKTGFEIKGIRSLPLDVFYISMLSEKYKGTKLYFITGMIKGFWFYLITLFNDKKSSSIIYLLGKQTSSNNPPQTSR